MQTQIKKLKKLKETLEKPCLFRVDILNRDGKEISVFVKELEHQKMFIDLLLKIN